MATTKEHLSLRIVKVPYVNPHAANSSGSATDNYRKVFLTSLSTDPSAWITPQSILDEHFLRHLENRLRKDKSHFLDWPTVYIVWFANTSEDNAAIRPWCVYVGETQHIIDRTVQHVLTNQKNVPDRAEDLEIVADNEDAQSDAIVPIQHLKHYLDSEHKADQRITAAVQSDKTDVNQYVIWERHFNKSLTLDIENKLIDYMKSIDGVECLNGRGNPQDSYYTSEYRDAIVSKVWSRLVNTDDNSIFPPELEIWQSSLYKVSPFHKLGSEQRRALQDITSEVERLLHQWNSPDDTRLILVEGAAGTGKSILLSTLFYELSTQFNNDDDSPTDSLHQKVFLLVNNEDQMHVYDDMALKHGLQKKYGQCVSRPARFINERSAKAQTGWDYTTFDEDARADVVLIDEAHLLFTQKVQSGIENQLHEILRRSKVVIAVFDSEQIMQRKQWWNPETLRLLASMGRKSHDVTVSDALQQLEPLTLRSSYSNRHIDAGASHEIEDRYEVEKIILHQQFRIDAGQDTLSWLDNIAENQPYTLTDANGASRSIPHDKRTRFDVYFEDDDTITTSEHTPYEIKVCRSPEVLFDAIRNKGESLLRTQEQHDFGASSNRGKRTGKYKSAAAVKPRDLCRVLATFDWHFDVKNKTGNVVLVKDRSHHVSSKESVETWSIPVWNNGEYATEDGQDIFSKPWNRSKDNTDCVMTKSTGKEAWSSSNQTRNEIGSYFTIQGFDLNYAGVLIGPSVSYDRHTGRLVFLPENSCDPGVTSDRGDIDDEAQEEFKRECIRKQLNVLLKRGVHGLYLFAVDPELQKALWEAADDEQRLAK